MGQKVSPHGLRVGVIQDWDSREWVRRIKIISLISSSEDKKIREYVKKKLYMAGISRILIERAANDQLRLTILTGKPGMIIGRSGAGIDELKADLEKLTKKNVSINIVEVKKNRTRRTAHCGKHRSGSREKNRFQKSDEAGDRQNDEGRQQGYQSCVIRQTGRR